LWLGLGGDNECIQNFVRKSVGKSSVERSRQRGEDNNRIRKVDCEDWERTELAYDLFHREVETLES
jgi:hypothetical protein